VLPVAAPAAAVIADASVALAVIVAAVDVPAAAVGVVAAVDAPVSVEAVEVPVAAVMVDAPPPALTGTHIERGAKRSYGAAYRASTCAADIAPLYIRRSWICPKNGCVVPASMRAPICRAAAALVAVRAEFLDTVTATPLTYIETADAAVPFLTTTRCIQRLAEMLFVAASIVSMPVISSVILLVELEFGPYPMSQAGLFDVLAQPKIEYLVVARLPVA
jgi:hypothetical protein